MPLCAAPNLPPAGFADLATRPAFVLHIGYATAENFTGVPLPGYGWPGAWLQAPAADALERVAADLQAEGYSLVIFDAYRPRRASAAMVQWANLTAHSDLLGTYIAARSGHNDGGSVDVGLAGPDGALLDLGAPWDTFDASAHTANAIGQPAVLRAALSAAMTEQGWRPYDKEWWHFRYSAASRDALDRPYGDCEPEEPR